MIGLANPQAGYLDEAMRRRLLADALMRQGSFGSGAIGGFMPIGTAETAGTKPIVAPAPPLATGVPQSMVRAGMPQPVRGGS
jgi:hypothetical protein